VHFLCVDHLTSIIDKPRPALCVRRAMMNTTASATPSAKALAVADALKMHAPPKTDGLQHSLLSGLSGLSGLSELSASASASASANRHGMDAGITSLSSVSSSSQSNTTVSSQSGSTEGSVCQPIDLTRSNSSSLPQSQSVSRPPRWHGRGPPAMSDAAIARHLNTANSRKRRLLNEASTSPTAKRQKVGDGNVSSTNPLNALQRSLMAGKQQQQQQHTHNPLHKNDTDPNSNAPLNLTLAQLVNYLTTTFAKNQNQNQTHSHTHTHTHTHSLSSRSKAGGATTALASILSQRAAAAAANTNGHGSVNGSMGVLSHLRRSQQMKQKQKQKQKQSHSNEALLGGPGNSSPNLMQLQSLLRLKQQQQQTQRQRGATSSGIFAVSKSASRNSGGNGNGNHNGNLMNLLSSLQSMSSRQRQSQIQTPRSFGVREKDSEVVSLLSDEEDCPQTTTQSGKRKRSPSESASLSLSVSVSDTLSGSSLQSRDSDEPQTESQPQQKCRTRRKRMCNLDKELEAEERLARLEEQRDRRPISGNAYIVAYAESLHLDEMKLRDDECFPVLRQLPRSGLIKYCDYYRLRYSKRSKDQRLLQIVTKHFILHNREKYADRSVEEMERDLFWHSVCHRHVNC